MTEFTEANQPPDRPMHIDRPVLTEYDLNQWLGQPDSPELPSFSSQLRKASIHTIRFLAPDCLHSKFSQKQSNKDDDDENNNSKTDPLADASKSDTTSRARKHLCANRAHLCGVWLISFFPFIGILKKYEMKNWFLNDLIAGLTVGIMHVPQGMAYAMLATLPPVYGLYTSFFPPLVYFFFGTSRHISIGTIAVVSLLTGEFLDKIVHDELAISSLATQPELNDSLRVSPFSSKETLDPMAIRVRYAPALAMTVGFTQIAMGLFRMGGVIRYLSGPMTSGFTVGVAVHVLTSQVKTLVGVKIPKPVGLFTVPRTYYEVLRTITSANLVTIGLSAVCILIIAVFKTWINPRVVKRIRVPLPIDLVIVILSTVVSYFLELNPKYDVKVVGHVAKGIQPPVVPNLRHMHAFIGDIIVLAVVAFSVNVSLTRIFAKTYNYKSDCNQELYAYGLSNIVSSFFHTYPAAASLSRSAVQVSAGGKTQVATLFSSVLLILVLYFIGPLFFTVPNCCLSAIIVVALKGMFIHALELKHLWKYSIWDFAIWLLTCICTVLLDVKFGLLSGIAFSALTVILRTQAPKARVLGQVDGTELYRDVRTAGRKCTQPSAIKVVRYEGSIYYACAEQFRNSIYHHVDLDPSYLFTRMQKIQGRLRRVEKEIGIPSTESSSLEKLAIMNEKCADATTSEKLCSNEADAVRDYSKDEMNEFYLSSIPVPINMTEKRYSSLERKRAKLLRQIKQLEEKCSLQFVVLDCSCWTFVDFVGAEELNQVVTDFRRIDVCVLLAELNGQVAQTLRRNGKLQTETELFPTVHDAVLWAMCHIQNKICHLKHVQEEVRTFNEKQEDQSANSNDTDEEREEINDYFKHKRQRDRNATESHVPVELALSPNLIVHQSPRNELK